MAQDSLLTHKEKHVDLLSSCLYLSAINQKRAPEETDIANSIVSTGLNKLLLKKLAKQETPKPESDKEFEAKRRLFLEYKNIVYQNYNESLENLEKIGRKLNNTEKYSLFINKFFEDVEGLSALLPNRYNTKRETSRMFLNHFIQTFSKSENQILNGTSKPHAEVIESFVGSGKTFLIGMMLAALPDGLKAFISTPGKDLQRQLLNTIVRFAPDKKISQISSNNYQTEPASIEFKDGTTEERQIPYGLQGDIVFAVNDSVTKLQKGLLRKISQDDINAFEPALIIFDEVHKITSNSRQNTNIKTFIKGLIDKGGSFIGFSATPNNFTALPTSKDDIMVPVGKAALFTHPDRLDSQFLDTVNIETTTEFKRSLEDGIKAGELADLRWHKIDISSKLKQANPDFDLFSSLKEEDINTDEQDIKANILEELLNKEVNTANHQSSWDIICESIAQKINSDSQLKSLRGFSFTPNIEKSQILAKTLTEKGIPAASYSSKGIFIPTEIFNKVQNQVSGNGFNKISDNKEFQGTAKNTEHNGYTLIPLNDSNRNHNKNLLFKLLKDKVIKNISSVSMLGTGIDLPWLELAVMAKPTNSHTEYVQNLGRVTRLDPKNPQKIAHVLDAVIEGNNLFQPFNLPLATGYNFADNDSLNQKSTEAFSENTQAKNKKTSETRAEQMIKIPDSLANFYTLEKIIDRVYQGITTKLKQERENIVSIDDVTQRLNLAIESFLEEKPDFCREDLIKKNSYRENIYNPLIWFPVEKNLIQEIQKDIRTEINTGQKIRIAMTSLAESNGIDARYIIGAVKESKRNNQEKFNPGEVVTWSEDEKKAIIQRAQELEEKEKDYYKLTDKKDQLIYQAFRFRLANEDKKRNVEAKIKNVALKSICHEALDPDGDYTIFAVTTEEWQKAQESQVSKFLQVDPELFVSLKEIQEKTYKILHPNESMPTTDRSYGVWNTAPTNIESLVIRLMNKKDLILKDQNHQPIQLIPLNSDGMISTGKSKFELETAKGLSIQEFKGYMEKVTQLAENTEELIFIDKEIPINNEIKKIDIRFYDSFKQWIREQYPQEKEHQALMRDFTTRNGFKRIVQSASGENIDLLEEYLKSRKTKKA